MNQNGQFTWIAGFIWGIADDVLRDLYVRGKYRDVILPMTVLRRLDAVLEPTKKAVLDMKASLDKVRIANQDAALRQAAGQAFYNTSKFTLRDLRARASQQQLKADFEAYLDGFSPNVQDILEKFEFRNQIPRLSKADALGTLIEKFLSPEINLGPNPVLQSDGSVKHPGLDNHAMGTIFEELVRRFNEENNEEAGEHWTPRDAVRLMARLIFLPIADRIESGTYLIYDGACGTGGMLTVAEEHGWQVAAHLCKSFQANPYHVYLRGNTWAPSGQVPGWQGSESPPAKRSNHFPRRRPQQLGPPRGARVWRHPLKTALLVVDAQRIYTDPESDMYCRDAKGTMRRINELIDAFQRKKGPIVLIRHVHKRDGSDLGRLFDFSGEPTEDFNFKEGTPEVGYDSSLVRPSGCLEIIKTRYSAFANTSLARDLRERGVGRVAICGFMTNFCCESTARTAHDLDFYVDFLPDATGTPGTENMDEKQVRRVVAELLAEGFARVLSTKKYLAGL